MKGKKHILPNYNKYWLFSIVSIIAISIIAVFVTILGRQYIIYQAESRIRDVMHGAEALHHYYQKDMHPTMYKLKEESRLPTNFYSPQMLSSTFVARNVFKHYNQTRENQKLPLVKYRIASKNPRNQVNKAGTYEISLIDKFNNDNKLKKYSGIIEEHGIKHLYYAKPFLRVEERCLKCHGSKDDAPNDLRSYYNWSSGFDWQLGVIPAIEIIKTPLIAENNDSLTITLIIIATTILILTLILLYSRSIFNNDIIKKQKEKIEQTLEKLKATQSQLIQNEKMASLGILTAGVAHEINNPLNYIMGGYAGIEKYYSGNKEIEEKQIPALMNSIKNGLERVSNIVSGLNQFSRDNENLNERCDIHPILDNCLVMLHNQFKHRINITKNYSNAPLIINGNVGKLHQVFINIISNSIQAIKDKGEIYVKTKINVNNAFIEISDTGCGIKKEDIKKICDPFFTTKNPGEGTGLGMSISYSIIKDHKGSIKYESEVDKGTKVIITLPNTLYHDYN